MSFGYGSLFVGDLSVCVSENHLHELFSEYGRILSLEIKKGKKAFKLLEYGFVDFASSEEAQLAIDNLNGRLVFGRKLRCVFCWFSFFQRLFVANCRVNWADDAGNLKKPVRAEIAFSFISRQVINS